MISGGIEVNYTLFFISNTFISNARLEMAKNQAKAKQQPETKPLLCFLHPCYHPNIIGDTLKNVVKKKEFI